MYGIVQLVCIPLGELQAQHQADHKVHQGQAITRSLSADGHLRTNGVVCNGQHESKFIF